MSRCGGAEINVGAAYRTPLVSDALRDTDLQQIPHLSMMCKYSHHLIDMGITLLSCVTASENGPQDSSIIP